MSGRLAGMGVVLTRPRAAADPLARALQAEGAKVFVFPALAIEPLEPTAALEALLGKLAERDLAIFVSANAVEHGLAMARRFGAWPAGLRAAAIGEATAEALRNSGIAGVISPSERHDSDGLLALREMQAVEGQNIVVFRGEGGRERIKEALEERGASVAYAECYRRVRPKSDPRPLLDAWERGEVQAVSALSAETLRNFVAMAGAGAEPLLARTTLVVPHAAIGGIAEARRFGAVRVTAHGARALIDTLSGIRVAT